MVEVSPEHVHVLKVLSAEFQRHGVVGGQFFKAVLDREQEHALATINRYPGHRVLMDSFWDLFTESLERAIEVVRQTGWPMEKPDYYPFLLHFVVLFRKARAADKLSTSGYPLEGYGVLRDVKDQTLVLLGLGLGMTSFVDLEGNPSPGPDGIFGKSQAEEALRRAKKEEGRLKKLLIGSGSGLGAEVQQELDALRDMFHMQVHGSKLDRFGELGRWNTGQPFKINVGPIYKETDDALYINRSHETAWMIVRLFPLLQPNTGTFGADWARRWEVVDAAIRVIIADNLEGKKLGTVFAEFIDTKMPFNTLSCFPERHA